jgi:hypothetical protein
MDLRKNVIRLSISMQTGLDYLMSGLSVFDLVDIMKEVSEIGKEQQRLRNGNKNRRRN